MTVDEKQSLSMTLGKKTLWLVLGQSVSRSGQIGIALLLVKFLSPTEWNAVALSLTVYLAAVTIGSFNLEHSVLFYLPSLSQSHADALFARTVVSLMGVGGVLGFGLVVATSWGGILSSPVIGALIALAVALEIPTVIAGPALIARGHERASGIWDASHGFIRLVLVVAPAVFALGEVGVMLGLAAASLIRFVSFVALFIEDVRGKWQIANRRLFRRQLMFCAPLGVAVATGLLTRIIDKWLVAWKLPAKVGVYAIAAQEVPILSVLPYASGAAIAVVMVKHFGEGDHNSSFVAWTQQVQRMCQPVIGLTFLLVVISPQIFELAFDPTYKDSVLPFQIFSFIGLHRVTEYGAVFRAAGRTREIVLSSVLLFALNFTFAGFGLVLYGLIGLTLGSVLAFALAWLWVLRRLSVLFCLKLKEVFPWKIWSANIFYFATIAAASELIAAPFTLPLVELLVKCTIFGCSFLIANASDADRSVLFARKLGGINVQSN